MSSDESSCSQSHHSEKQVTKAEEKKPKKTTDKPKTKIIINVSDCQYSVVSKVGKSMGWKLQNTAQGNWDVFWTDNAVQPQMLLRMQQHQKINHFPGMFNLSRKNLMGRNLMKMRKKFANQYGFFPLTWMLPLEYQDLKNYYDSKPKGKARTFIVKPQALSQGKGIYLTRKIQQIDQNSHCVVQRYMHKPYLIDQLKFDLRVYVLVAGVDPLKLFIFHEGLTRFATQKYQVPTKQNMEDVCMHLTNYAINKDNPKFVFNSSAKDMSVGHKRSLTWLFDYLRDNDPNSANLKQKIEDMIVKTMISGLPAIASQYKSCQPQNYASNMCFELLGFDVMLTEKCQPVLLEINYTPSFSTDTPLDKHIKFNYIKDALTLMNINDKTKNQIIKQRKEACHQRVITGKKVKLTPEQKAQLRAEAQAKRDKYQQAHLGGFKRIYPVEDEQKMKMYSQLLDFAQETFLMSTGTKKQPQRKAQKSESAFGTSFNRKNIQKPASVKVRQSVPDHLNIAKRKYEMNRVTTKKQVKITQSESVINSRNPIPKPQEELFQKQDELKNQDPYDKYFKTMTPLRYDSTRHKKQSQNVKNIEIMFGQTDMKDSGKNAFNQNVLVKSKQQPQKYKLTKTVMEEKKRVKWESKFTNRNQKQKIPITLNTLLISGFEANTNQSANNLKKILCNQQK